MDINFNESTHLPIDRPYNYSHNGQNFNALTIGACSYLCGAALKCVDYSRYLPHILIGRFSSLAGNITFFAGQNHEYKNVATTFPFDAFDVVKKICVAANVSELNYFPHEKRFDNHYQIIIGHDVWIGNGAQIISGVKIGSGAIVGTNSVVTKDVPPYAIAAGNPARIIRYRFDAETVEKFMALKWWNWSVKKIYKNLPLIHDTEKFLAKHLPQVPAEDFDAEIFAEINSKLERGWNVFQFVADFRAAQPLWKKVIREFSKSNFEKTLLVIWTGRGKVPEKLDEILADAGSHVLKIPATGRKIFQPKILRAATHFITTREMSTLECLDWLYGSNVKIISALDDEIFAGEPEVSWNEIYLNV